MVNRDNLINTFLGKNKQINLSAIRDEDWVMVKHIQDSLELEKIIDRKEWMKIADIGTGGWFPLMPLAISLSFASVDILPIIPELINGYFKHTK